jgi:hypothetical protein
MKRFLLAASLFALGAGGARAEDEGEVSYAYYLISCGSYIQHRLHGAPSDNNNTADTFYVAGWLSAYNRLSTDGGIPEDTTLENVMLWLEQYCRTNPLSNLETGLFKLGDDLNPSHKDTQAQKSSVPAPTTAPARSPALTPSPAPAPTPAPASPWHTPMPLKPLTF